MPRLARNGCIAIKQGAGCRSAALRKIMRVYCICACLAFCLAVSCTPAASGAIKAPRDPSVEILLDDGFRLLEPEVFSRLSSLSEPPLQALPPGTLATKIEERRAAWKRDGEPEIIVASPLVARFLGGTTAGYLLVIAGEATTTSSGKTIAVLYDGKRAYASMGAAAAALAGRMASGGENGQAEAKTILAIQEPFRLGESALESFVAACPGARILRIPYATGAVDPSGAALESIRRFMEETGGDAHAVLALALADPGVVAQVSEAFPETPLLVDKSLWAGSDTTVAGNVRGWIDPRPAALAAAAVRELRRLEARVRADGVEAASASAATERSLVTLRFSRPLFGKTGDARSGR